MYNYIILCSLLAPKIGAGNNNIVVPAYKLMVVKYIVCHLHFAYYLDWLLFGTAINTFIIIVQHQKYYLYTGTFLLDIIIIIVN